MALDLPRSDELLVFATYYSETGVAWNQSWADFQNEPP